MKNFYSFIIGSLLICITTSATCADEDYPTIHHALAALEQTEEELKSGESGFGGHRSKAIEHIDAALIELHQALEYADAHPDEIKPASSATH